MLEMNNSISYVKSKVMFPMCRKVLIIDVNPIEYTLQCKADMFQRLNHILDIKNEAGVWYTYADPIVAMLYDAFGYHLELEDNLEDA